MIAIATRFRWFSLRSRTVERNDLLNANASSSSFFFLLIYTFAGGRIE